MFQSHFSLAVSLILMSCTAVLYLAAEIVVDLGEVKELQTIASVYFSAFSGRTNKLVDGCYSFWQGGAVAVLDGWYNEMNVGNEKLGGENQGLSFDEVMLQRYILLCAQDVNGGLRDKPSKGRDFYHSCYNLSGLSVAQHTLCSWPPTSCDTRSDDEKTNSLFGDREFNILGRTDPVLNVRVERARAAANFFR